MDDNTAQEILRSIALSGSATKEINVIIGGNLSHILNISSGSPRLHNSIAKKFKLILSMPQTLSTLNPFEIRCALCKRVINYPAWYYSIKYAVNQFHYFVCFDAASSDKPTAKCYRRVG